MEDRLDLPLRKVLKIMQDRIVHKSTYFGIKTRKSPIDFWIYQEILSETKPDFIIEIGNYCGGSTLALAHICDCLGKGRVVGLDISHEHISNIVRNHPRITLIQGDACESFTKVKQLISDMDDVIIIEDSSHTYENTLNVLETYSGLVRPGGYFIVEDGICHHGLEVGPNPGPYEAINTFVKKNGHFKVDRSREPFLLTWNPKGYLKRVR
jgi:cephalosporin hydroxylase